MEGFRIYLSTHRGMGDHGIAYIASVLRRLVAFLQEREVRSPDTCTLADLDAWIAHELAAKPLKHATIGGRVSTLRGFFKYLHGEGYTTARLWTGLEAPRVFRETTLPPHYSWSDTAQLLTSAVSDPRSTLRDIAIVWLLASAGLRACEAIRLRVTDIDWNQATITTRVRKRSKPLVLPLLPAALEALRAYIDRERPSDTEHDHLLLSDDSQPFKSGDAVSRTISTLSTRALLFEDSGAHALRRGLGVRLLETGAGLGQISLILGHDNPKSTRAYLRASMAQFREVADNYANLL
ncbi:MAG TPA: tyrosine-type recombinase/integrase [Candidatus Xenobia bacterium]